MLRKESDTQYAKSDMDLDRLLVEEIGQCGKFQILIIVQCWVGVVFYSFMMSEYLFTAARIETRCLIPECEDPTQTQFSPPWITHAVPSSGGSLDNCQRFGNASHFPFSNESSCPATLFDTSVLQSCDEYVYETTDTLVYDFGLACKEWWRSIIGSLRQLSMGVALVLTGLISDRWGRRRALAINAVCTAALGVLRYWAPNYLIYMVLFAIEGILGCGSFTSTYVLILELLGPKYRTAGAASINTMFAIGQVLLALIAWAVTSGWRNLILVLYVPQFITIAFFWTLTESVRWLMRKGRFEESEELLKKAARINGNNVSQKSLDELRLNANQMLQKESDNISLIPLVLREKRLMLRCLVTCVWWVSAVFVYYGLSINAVNLSGNKYLNYVWVSAVEIPGYWTVALINGRVGRKPILITTFWLCAACQFAFIFISKDLAVLSLVVYLLGKWAISVELTAMHLYTMELYPTESRHRFYAFSCMVGRLGSIVSPLTPALGVTFFAELPFILFGGMAFLAGLLTFLVPETLGRKLADTMNEALDMRDHENRPKNTKE